MAMVQLEGKAAMPQSHLPRDPFAAHEVVMQRAEQVYEQRQEERRKPLPEHARADVRFEGLGGVRLSAEVLDVSPSGMRLAAFVDQAVQQGDRCQIVVLGDHASRPRMATVRWVTPHRLIQVFGVEFERV